MEVVDVLFLATVGKITYYRTKTDYVNLLLLTLKINQFGVLPCLYDKSEK